jgi:hypothetical protein
VEIMPTDERQRFLGELASGQGIDSREQSREKGTRGGEKDKGKPGEPGDYQKKTGEIKKAAPDD